MSIAWKNFKEKRKPIGKNVLGQRKIVMSKRTIAQSLNDMPSLIFMLKC